MCPYLRKKLEDASELLYLLDNTGEILFDRPLIEKIGEYGVDVKVAVKGKAHPQRRMHGRMRLMRAFMRWLRS